MIVLHLGGSEMSKKAAAEYNASLCAKEQAKAEVGTDYILDYLHRVAKLLGKL